MQLTLSPEEAAMLREILASAASELRMEIADTDAREFREALRVRERLLLRLVGELGDDAAERRA